jgi:hypothetical protein
MELVTKFCGTYGCAGRMFNGMLILNKGGRSVKIKGFGQMDEKEQRHQLVLARETLHLKQAA